MGIATFAGVSAVILAEWYCGNINFLNALRRGNKHTGVLWLSAFFNKFIKWKIQLIVRKLLNEQKLFYWAIVRAHF